MKNAFIVDGVRTPIGSFGGSLSSVRADDLAAHTIAELMRRHPDVPADQIADVVLGSANQAGEDNRNVARMALLLAGLPTSVPGVTVNRLCASGMHAVVDAARGIANSDGDLYIAGGVEHMTRAPYVMSKAAQAFARNVEMFDTSIGWRFVNPKMKDLYGIDAMGETAENVAEQFKVSREDQDEFACNSQMKAAAARKAGRFEREIASVSIPSKKETKVFAEDEFIRPDTSREVLAKLKPAFRAGGSVTAGNSSGINDGSVALLIASEDAVKKYNLEPLIMGMGPVPSSLKALSKAGLNLDQIDVIELNEAFAAQSLACLRELGIADDDPRVNPNGGAIALGHPLGMSGARLLLTAAHELKEKEKHYALCTMCVGVGQGMATIIERA